MKKLSMWLFVSALLGLAAPASASLIFDIIDDGGGPTADDPTSDDDGIVGFIQFASDGLITTTGGIVGFQYTTEGGTVYTAADITSIRVLVDNPNSRLCWRAADTETVCENGFDIAGSGTFGLLIGSVDNGYAFSVDATAPANYANAFPLTPNGSPLDRFIQFVPRSIPEPATLVLLGLGLAGIGYQRRK